MPEAVIVATARSPIGRAFKGSLKDLRPDDLTRRSRARPARQGARRSTPRRSTTSTRLRPPGGEHGLQHGPRRRRPRRHGRPARRDGQPLLLLVAADHPDGLPRDQGRRGRRLHLGRRRDASRASPRARRRRQLTPSTQNPLFADAAGPQRRGRPQGGRDLARPARGRPAPRHLHRDGPDRRERRAAARASPARSMDEFGVRSQNLAEKAIADGFWEREITRSPLPDGTVVTRRRRPARRRHPRGGRRRSSRCSAPTARSPPATAARSTTAPPRWSS